MQQQQPAARDANVGKPATTIKTANRAVNLAKRSWLPPTDNSELPTLFGFERYDSEERTEPSECRGISNESDAKWIQRIFGSTASSDFRIIFHTLSYSRIGITAIVWVRLPNAPDRPERNFWNIYIIASGCS